MIVDAFNQEKALVHSRGLLCDYENFAESSLRPLVSNQAAKAVAGSGQLSAEKP